MDSFEPSIIKPCFNTPTRLVHVFEEGKILFENVFLNQELEYPSFLSYSSAHASSEGESSVSSNNHDFDDFDFTKELEYPTLLVLAVVGIQVSTPGEFKLSWNTPN